MNDFDPELGAGQDDRHSLPSADHVDHRLHDDLGEDRAPQLVPDRPAAIALLLQAVIFDVPGVERAAHDGTRGEGIERRAPARGVAVGRCRHVQVMPGDVRDIAGAVEIADLRIFT